VPEAPADWNVGAVQTPRYGCASLCVLRGNARLLPWEEGAQRGCAAAHALWQHPCFLRASIELLGSLFSPHAASRERGRVGALTELSAGAARSRERGTKQRRIRDEFFGDLTFEERAPSLGRADERAERIPLSARPSRPAGAAPGGGGRMEVRRGRRADDRASARPYERASSPGSRPGRAGEGAGDLGSGWFGDDDFAGTYFGNDAGAEPAVAPGVGAGADLDWDTGASGGADASVSSAEHTRCAGWRMGAGSVLNM